MKLFLPASILFVSVANASTDFDVQQQVRRRLAACDVVNFDYGTGVALDQSRGNSDIVVEKGNVAKCQVLCDNAANLQLFIGYGPPGNQNEANADASNTNMNCGDTLSAENTSGDQGFEFIVKADSYTNLRVQCGCPTEDQSSGGGCFSGSDTVQVKGHGTVAMKDLRVGDNVLTDFAANKYEPIYSFGHFHETAKADFVKLKSSSKESLTLTPNHLVYANGNTVRADQVKKDDRLSSGTVSETSIVSKQGLFMPLTPSGKILVNNLQASTYVSMGDYAPIQQHPLLKFWLTEDFLVHLWLSPLRMYCLGVTSNYCPSHPESIRNVDGDAGIMSYLRLGKDIAEFALRQNTLIQIVMGVPIFATLGAFYSMEFVVGASLAPLAALLMAVFLYRRQQNTTTSNQKQKAL